MTCVACSADKDQEIAKRLEGHWYVEYTADTGATYRMVGENRSNQSAYRNTRDGAIYRARRVSQEHKLP